MERIFKLVIYRITRKVEFTDFDSVPQCLPVLRLSVDHLDLGRIKSRRKEDVFTAIEKNSGKLFIFFSSYSIYWRWNPKERIYLFFSADGRNVGWATASSPIGSHGAKNKTRR